MLEVRELSNDADVWDRLIASSPQGSAFLRADWLEMLCETDPSQRVLMLGCYDAKDRLVGGQAIPYSNYWGMDVSVPFEFFYCGPVLAPLAGDNRARQALDHHRAVSALARAASERLAYIQVETHPTFEDARPFLYSGWQVAPTYTHIWRMDDADRTWQDMNREKRREIRRARETFVFGVEDDDATLDAFLPLYHQTMRKFVWRPSVRWEDIFRRRFHWMRQRDGCRLYTARTPDGELMGGVAVLLSAEDRTAYLWRQGSGRAFIEAGGVPALYWQAACDLAATFPNVNFGGSPQVSLSHFKDYLGAVAVPHFQVTTCSRRNRMAALEWGQRIKDAAYNLAMRVAFKPWQLLRYGKRGNAG